MKFLLIIKIKPIKLAKNNSQLTFTEESEVFICLDLFFVNLKKFCAL